MEPPRVPPPILGASSSSSPQRRTRLQRSERLPGPASSESNATSTYSSWETLVRDSFGQITWPIRLTSWELVNDPAEIVPTSSSATELISRRGVFARRNYGSVDKLPQCELEGLDQNCRRFRLENGESMAEKDEVFGSPSTPILENPEHQTRWYFKYFLGRLHQNYVGIDSDKNPYFLSVVSQDSGSKYMPLYRVILFRKQGAQKLALPYNPQQKLTVKQILGHFPSMDTNKTPKELFSADIQKDLLLLEEQEGSVNFKFGVVYMKGGQKADDEMLSNESGSEDFDEFLGVLGEKIRLKGWQQYKGGLDVKNDMTGKYSIYTIYEGHEIMFHVSTLLPFSRDRQQVERKRHIGNDIINIIFVDGDEADFSPNCIKSQFTHIFAVVTKRRKTYRLSMYCDETVPPFGPTLPDPPEFQSPTTFREFLLVKLINGEKATFQTPTFFQKRQRTLEMLIRDLYEEYQHDSKMQTMLNRRAFSEVLYDAPRTSKLKEDARQVEFVRIGQALKLEAIVRGDAPTSLATAGPGSVFKRPPWEPHCFYAAFNHRGNIVGDSWGCDALFLATDEGTFLIKEDQSHQIVFDRTFTVRQLSVCEDYGIVLIRGGAATHKDGHRIYVFQLTDFKDENIKCRARMDVKTHRIEKTRGTHLYSISSGTDGHLKMAVAIGRKLLMYQWKDTAAKHTWCNNGNYTADGFLFLREITLHETPSILTIIEGYANSKLDPNHGNIICCGFKHNFDVVCESTGQSFRLHEIEMSKRSQTQLVAALDLYDGHETELLLCYNHTCHFQKLDDENSSTEFDFHWNSSPTSVICAFPYVIAFTNDSMEIRLLVNGNLVHMVSMAELQLITSKKDIFFATTAPEFIPKDNRIKGLENESESPKDNVKQSPRIGEISSERILEIKNQIEKIEESQRVDIEADVPINAKDDLNRLLVCPGEDLPSIHRARSLQGKERGKESDDAGKRHISKSNSCGETTTAEFAPNRILVEPSVPPNSPKSATTDSPGSPNNRKFSKSLRGEADVGEKLKPLRIYRIPIANLTGTHHAQSYHPQNAKTSKVHKILEDHTAESEEVVAAAAEGLS
ncbi:GTPase-activating Rap/Ran-GAP domain-like protein 3 isoform X3 [Lutzomyia longipalpis]|uniref:GTPase-activating Rap/Ran-GAP domain-like protein 3 isoform X3 n=1 Tax=Lutzomyia longipalpis TaxID=7200 RepID=UPI002484051E|nr:GTPase-activating Rap/Ran-GAP domain-like protein 3 isoform X3 [Lutzomyia longipalpis]